MLPRSGLGACCLTILIFLILLNVLRVPLDHATPVFSDLKVKKVMFRLKVSVYGVKGECLWFECLSVKGECLKGECLWEATGNPRPAGFSG